MGYNKEIYYAVEAYMLRNNMAFATDQQDGCFYFDVPANRKLCRTLHCKLKVGMDHYIVYCMMPFVPDADDPKDMAAMYELVCRANCGMPFGRFEISPDDGEICYRYETDCIGFVVPESAQVGNSIRISVQTVLCYMEEAFFAVLREAASPAEACAAAETRLPFRKAPAETLRSIIWEHAARSYQAKTTPSVLCGA